MKRAIGLFALVISVSITLAGQTSKMPGCPGRNGQLPVNNEEILQWKGSTKVGWSERGHALGRIVEIYPDRNGHLHFSIQIGRNEEESLEIVYNESFGRVDDLRVGDKVQACGDYITANGKHKGYPPSPDGAILHWVHENPRSGGHPSGFMMVNDRLFGYRRR